jgi:hypothetical protein
VVSTGLTRQVFTDLFQEKTTGAAGRFLPKAVSNLPGLARAVLVGLTRLVFLLRIQGNSYGVCSESIPVVPPVKTGGYLRGTPPGFDAELSFVFIF